jgi:hypothetical protein
MNGSDDVVPSSNEGEEANITQMAILVPSLHIQNIAEALAPTSTVSTLDAVMHSDGQQDLDFDLSSMLPLLMAQIYKQVMEIKQNAARVPESSVTKPETDVPLQLMHISKVRIYISMFYMGQCS